MSVFRIPGTSVADLKESIALASAAGLRRMDFEWLRCLQSFFCLDRVTTCQAARKDQLNSMEGSES